MNQPSYERYNQYRLMWVIVFYDLPTTAKYETKAANKFRKILLEDGFTMFQFSTYIRSCPSKQNAEVHENRVKKAIPKNGKVGIITITDRQFGQMKIFHGRMPKMPPSAVQQLEFF